MKQSSFEAIESGWSTVSVQYSTVQYMTQCMDPGLGAALAIAGGEPVM